MNFSWSVFFFFFFSLVSYLTKLGKSNNYKTNFYVKSYKILKIARKVSPNSRNGKRNSFIWSLKSFLIFKAPSSKFSLNSFLIQRNVRFVVQILRQWDSSHPWKYFQRIVQLNNISSSAPAVSGILKGFCTSLSLFVLIKFVLIKSCLLPI